MKKLLLVAGAILAAISSQAQWQPDIRLTNSPDSSITTYGYSHCVDTHGDTVHVVWYDRRDGNFEIYYKRSLDNGLTWDVDTRLTNEANRSTLPCVSVSGSVVHVVWRDTRDGNNGEIYYKQSQDGGTIWGNDIRLTFDPAYSSEPSVVANDSIIHVIWNDNRDGNQEIYYKRSTDRGVTWGPDTRLTNDPAASYNCSLAVSGQNIYVVWNDYRNTYCGIYLKKSTDGGNTWDPDTSLYDFSTSGYPSIAACGSQVHIVWSEWKPGGFEIYYKNSTDNAVTWSTDAQLTSDGAQSIWPNVVISLSTVHVVWQSDLNGNLAVYYKGSTDNGVTWSTETQLNDSLVSSLRPSIAVSGPVLHVVWYDFRDLNYEVYYKRNPIGGFPVGIENDKINNSAQQVIIYPNPASTNIHIKFNNEVNQSAGNKDEKNTLSIRNIIGVELLSKQIRNGESDVDVSNLQNGLYFMGITTSNNQSLNTKLIIAK